MPNKDIFTAAQNLEEVYNTDTDEQLGNKLIQYSRTSIIRANWDR